MLVAAILTLALAVGVTEAFAVRPPTKVERAGIVATLSRAFSEQRSCFARDLYRVSTVNPRYALWSGNNAYRGSRRCLTGNGYIILKRRTNGSWIRLFDASWDDAPCGVLGRRVARELTGLPCEGESWRVPVTG